MIEERVVKIIRNTIEYAQMLLVELNNANRDALDEMDMSTWGSLQGQLMQKKADNLENAQMLLGDTIVFLSRAEEMIRKGS